MRSVLELEFCTALEYAITRALQSSSRDGLKGFWCDGVILQMPVGEAELKTFDECREIQGTAWLGKQGQDQYDIVIRISDDFRQSLILEEDLKRYIPIPENDDRIYIHQETRQIIVWMI